MTATSCAPTGATAAPRGLSFKRAEFSPDSRHLAVEIDNVVTLLTVR